MTRPRARKRFGQHFLIDRHVVERIVLALELDEGVPLLEIGPGDAALTAGLIEATGRIAAVEVDRDLSARLRQRFDPQRLVLFERDVLDLPLEDVRAALPVDGDRRLVIAGNLPYNISKPVAMRLVEQRQMIDRAVLMFQREVAIRLTAQPGGRDYGPLTILVGTAFDVEQLFDVRPSAFRPPPAVTSTVTRWRRRQDTPPEDCLQSLKRCLAICFGQRRRMLRNNLRNALGGQLEVVESVLEEAGIEGQMRPEQLAPARFLSLSEILTRRNLL